MCVRLCISLREHDLLCNDALATISFHIIIIIIVVVVVIIIVITIIFKIISFKNHGEFIRNTPNPHLFILTPSLVMASPFFCLIDGDAHDHLRRRLGRHGSASRVYGTPARSVLSAPIFRERFSTATFSNAFISGTPAHSYVRHIYIYTDMHKKRYNSLVLKGVAE